MNYFSLHGSAYDEIVIKYSGLAKGKGVYLPRTKAECEDIVKTLLESRKGLTDEEFGSTILSLDMKEIVANKLSSIKTEYTKSHIEILKDTKPIGRND